MHPHDNRRPNFRSALSAISRILSRSHSSSSSTDQMHPYVPPTHPQPPAAPPPPPEIVIDHPSANHSSDIFHPFQPDTVPMDCTSTHHVPDLLQPPPPPPPPPPSLVSLPLTVPVLTTPSPSPLHQTFRLPRIIPQIPNPSPIPDIPLYTDPWPSPLPPVTSLAQAPHPPHSLPHPPQVPNPSTQPPPALQRIRQPAHLGLPCITPAAPPVHLMQRLRPQPASPDHSRHIREFMRLARANSATASATRPAAQQILDAESAVAQLLQLDQRMAAYEQTRASRTASRTASLTASRTASAAASAATHASLPPSHATHGTPSISRAQMRREPKQTRSHRRPQPPGAPAGRNPKISQSSLHPSQSQPTLPQGIRRPQPRQPRQMRHIQRISTLLLAPATWYGSLSLSHRRANNAVVQTKVPAAAFSYSLRSRPEFTESLPSVLNLTPDTLRKFDSVVETASQGHFLVRISPVNDYGQTVVHNVFAAYVRSCLGLGNVHQIPVDGGSIVLFPIVFPQAGLCFVGIFVGQ